MSETSGTANLEDFEKLDIRVGRVIDVQPFPEGRYSTHIVMIDFGRILARRSRWRSWLRTTQARN